MALKSSPTFHVKFIIWHLSFAEGERGIRTTVFRQQHQAEVGSHITAGGSDKVEAGAHTGCARVMDVTWSQEACLNGCQHHLRHESLS